MPSRPIMFLALLTALSCRSAAAPEPKSDAMGLKTSGVTVTTADGRSFDVQVEIVATPEDRARGLMYRRELGAESGMLFLFPHESVLSFWMKNTFIPLDMLFIAHDGTIVGIVENATPLTETPRTVGKPSRYVLEVNGGWCAKKGVKAGDRVELGAAIAAAHADVR